jgi:protoporphyrinogen IX oxidase
MWVGSLLVVSTLMTLAPPEAGAARGALLVAAKRLISRSSNLGALVAIVFGVAIIFAEPQVLTHGWFHAKLFFVLAMIACHLWLYRRVVAMENQPGSSTRRQFAMLHGIFSALLFVILMLVFLRPF